jgi:hypothetical protein
LAIAFALAGCRFGFDSTTSDGASSDGPGDGPGDAVSCTHDEDADGAADCVDLCPHIAGSQLDGDGDGVGDDCDPDPTRTNRLLTFIPFDFAKSLTLAGDDTFQETGELLHVDGTGRTEARLELAIGEVEIWVGGRINDATSTDERQVGILPNPSPGGTEPYFYSDLYQFMTNDSRIHVAEYDGNTFAALDTVPVGAFPTGAFVLRMSGRTTGVTTTLEAGSTFTSTAAASFTGSTGVTFVFSFLDLDVEYIAIVAAL